MDRGDVADVALAVLIHVADINRGIMDLPRQFSPFSLVVIRKASELCKTALHFGGVVDGKNAVFIDIAAQSADIHLIQSLRQAGIGAADIRVFQADKSVLLHVIDGVVKLKRIAAGILLKDPVTEHAVDDPLLLRAAVGCMNKHPVNLIVRKVNIQLVIDFRIEIFKIIIFVIHVFFVKFAFICVLRQTETFVVTKLNNSKAAKQFCKMLPLTVTMNELNGNEKYHYFDKEFSGKSKTYPKINPGDLMIFGGDCLVLFYDKITSSPYEYIKIGKLTNAGSLAKTLGRKNVKVKFTR